MTKRQIASFADLTTDQLRLWWDSIGHNPENIVKSGRSKGELKLSAIRTSDQLLAEIKRRLDAQEVV